MIVTKNWLNEFLDLSDVSTQTLLDTLNKIGQEVEASYSITIPDNVVIGYVETCQKHPDADKLNVTTVNVKNETLQIVCGAKNVAAGQYVAVAKVGAVLPGDFKIKKAKLRDVESYGMICASTEIGMPELESGIMVLDDSIGELELGKPLNEYPAINDTVIELGVTPNRGDCFSVYGIARELSAGLNKDLRNEEMEVGERLMEGVGRVLQVEHTNIKETSHILKVFKGENLTIPFKITYRLALCEKNQKKRIDALCCYTSQATGVLITAFDVEIKDGTPVKLDIVSDEGVECVLSNERLLYEVGIKKHKETQDSNAYIIDANYVTPEYVSTLVHEKKMESDEHFFRSSRGSEPDLDFGIRYLFNSIDKESIDIYNGRYDLMQDQPEKHVTFNINEIHTIIGKEISENTIITVLNRLGFEASFSVNDKTMNVTVPFFRHDITHVHDIAEEILRIYGIDTLEAKPISFDESDRTNPAIIYYRRLKKLRNASVSNGFYESLHFLFESKESLEKYGFESVEENLDILNPIVTELNTLRSTLLLQILRAAELNKKNGYKKIALFQIGTVVNRLREESEKAAFIYSGDASLDSINNNGKPKEITFFTFVEKLSNILGDFTLEEENRLHLVHPYQSAKILKEGVEIGFVAKLHPAVAKDFDLDDTYISEIFLDRLSTKQYAAEDIIKYQKTQRDLSVVVDKKINFIEIKQAIQSLHISDLITFYPIDIFDLGESNSLTVRFILQNRKKTLTEEEINGIIAQIVDKLKDLGVTLR